MRCSSSGVSASRARCATYFTSISIYASLLIKLALNERLNFRQRLRGVMSLGVNRQLAAGTRRQHHQTHDAFAIHLFAILLHENVATEPVGCLDEERCGSSVNAQFVGDMKIFCHYGPCVR